SIKKFEKGNGMAGYQSARTRAGEKDNIDDWMAAQNLRESRRKDPSARTTSHVVYGIAARTGQPLNAPTPSDVQALGARVLENKDNQPTTWGGQFRAGYRGALDSLPFGMSDAISD